MLGLTQQQIATLIGVTCQQAHKYETGINRISAGRLYQLAQALEVEVPYFFAGADTGVGPQSSRHQRVLLELARCFLAITDRAHQEALCSLARTLAGNAGSSKQRMRSTKSRHRQHWPRHEPDWPLLSQPESSDQGLMVLLKVEVMQPEAFDLADFHAVHEAMSLRYNAQLAAALDLRDVRSCQTRTS